VCVHGGREVRILRDTESVNLNDAITNMSQLLLVEVLMFQRSVTLSELCIVLGDAAPCY
jgi:hypothetical protein